MFAWSCQEFACTQAHIIQAAGAGHNAHSEQQLRSIARAFGHSTVPYFVIYCDPLKSEHAA